METIKVKFINSITWITNRRNPLFLIACLLIHAVYAVVFYMIGIGFLTALNFCSCCFYFFYLFIMQDTSEKSMLCAYFEILSFSVLNELALGPEYGFFLYIFGMSATIFYMLPSYMNKRFFYQSFGIALVMCLEAVVKLVGIPFPWIGEMAKPYQPAIFLANIGITASVMLASAFLYSQEIETVWASLNYNINHDTLTGLYNRRYLEHKIRHMDHLQDEFAITMVDIDFFKKVNDTYGHDAGDEVLVKVAACLMEAATEDNLAVRWGGEEFILFFPNTKCEQAYTTVENLRKQVENMVILAGGREIHVTITSGIAEGFPGSNYEAVIKSADDKLYIGKQKGRNQVVV